MVVLGVEVIPTRNISEEWSRDAFVIFPNASLAQESGFEKHEEIVLSPISRNRKQQIQSACFVWFSDLIGC
jgi:hypothetical protein